MSRRFPQLDGLRALAVLLVITHHYGVQAGFFSGSAWVLPLGSRLFFVLSGFLITRILWNCREAAESGQLGAVLRNFFCRRILRLMPLYFGYLSLLVWVSPLVRRNLLWFVTFTQNQLFFLRGFTPGGGHLWSMAVEEQFYLMWPLLVLALPRRLVPVAVASTVLLAPVSRLVLLSLHFSSEQFQLLTLCNLDSLGLGGLLALTGAGAPWVKRAVGPTLVLLLAAQLADRAVWSQALSTTALAFVLVWVVSGAVAGFGGGVGRVLESAPLASISRISYGLYILHPSVWWVAQVMAPELSLWLRLPLCLVLVFASASLSWRYFEAPLYRLRHHFPYPRPGLEKLTRSPALVTGS